jgi:signal transduction histidine kinase
MKSRYIIVFLHLLLYLIAYGCLVMKMPNGRGGVYQIMGKMMFAWMFISISLTVLTLIPVLGLIVSVYAGKKELKIGFSISAIMALVIDLYCWINP